jgi:hypothetical protein
MKINSSGGIRSFSTKATSKVGKARGDGSFAKHLGSSDDPASAVSSMVPT